MDDLSRLEKETREAMGASNFASWLFMIGAALGLGLVFFSIVLK